MLVTKVICVATLLNTSQNSTREVTAANNENEKHAEIAFQSSTQSF